MTPAIAIAVLILATASTGAIFTPGAWYEALRKPSWTPPNWMFPVVWSVLYVMIGVAGWIVFREAGWSAAMLAWGAQLVFNAAWSGLFFGLRRMRFALLDAALLVASIVAFIVLAKPISLVASLLFVPYLAWAITACALNLRVLQMNPIGSRPVA